MEETNALEKIPGHALVKYTGNAANILNAVLEEKDPYCWLYRGKEWIKQENYQDAILAFERAIFYKPELQNIYPHYAFSLCKLGQKEKAVEVLLRPFLEKYLRNLDDFRNQLKKEDWVYIYLIISVIISPFYESEDNHILSFFLFFCNAIDNFIDSKFLLENAEINPKATYWFLIIEGIRDTRKYNLINQAVEIGPRNPLGFYYRYEHFNNLDKAIELDPNYIEVYLRRGLLNYTEKNDDIDAIHDYSKVIELISQINELYRDEYNAKLIYDAYHKRAGSKHRIKDYIGAIQDYTMLTTFYSPDISKIYGIPIENILLRIGNSKYELKDYIGAIDNYTKVIEIKPNNEFAYYNRRNAWNALNEPEKAAIDMKIFEELRDKSESRNG